jgi:hypothetical protein
MTESMRLFLCYLVVFGSAARTCIYRLINTQYGDLLLLALLLQFLPLVYWSVLIITAGNNKATFLRDRETEKYTERHIKSTGLLLG